MRLVGADVAHAIAGQEGARARIVGPVLAGAVGSQLRVDRARRRRRRSLCLVGNRTGNESAGSQTKDACRNGTAVPATPTR